MPPFRQAQESAQRSKSIMRPPSGALSCDKHKRPNLRRHVELVTRRPNLSFQRHSRLEQSDQRRPDQAADISHKAKASPDSTSLASQIWFPIRTAVFIGGCAGLHLGVSFLHFFRFGHLFLAHLVFRHIAFGHAVALGCRTCGGWVRCVSGLGHDGRGKQNESNCCKDRRAHGNLLVDPAGPTPPWTDCSRRLISCL
jgi:hypothetical protein